MKYSRLSRCLSFSAFTQTETLFRVEEKNMEKQKNGKGNRPRKRISRHLGVRDLRHLSSPTSNYIILHETSI